VKKAEKIKKLNYMGLGLEKKKDRDPLDFTYSLPAARKPTQRANSTEAEAPKPKADSGESLPLSRMQERNLQFFKNLFQNWCKKKTSKFLRIDDFYRFMVIFGLAPNRPSIESLVNDFDKHIQKPVFAPVDYFIATQKLHIQHEFRSQKPFNQYFVYRVNFQGYLEVSHISFMAL